MDVKTIPGTIGFSASSDGKIFDKNGKEKNQYTNLDGYKTCAVLTTEYKWKTFGVHRLVCLAHLPYKDKLENLTVNHIDGEITNNNKKNLEWLSIGQNNIHAALMRGSKFRPMILGKKPDGTHEFIDNLFTAAKKFKTDISLVWECIRDKRHINNWMLSHYSNTSLIPKDLQKNCFPGGRGLGKLILRRVDILNIEDQTVKTYNSMHDAAKEHGVSSSLILRLMSTVDKMRLFKRKYLIVDSGFPFPIVNQIDYEKSLAPLGKNVFCYNVKLKKYVIYESASQFIRENKLSKKAVTVDLRKNRLRLLGDWWYIYNTPSNIEELNKVVSLYVSRQSSVNIHES